MQRAGGLAERRRPGLWLLLAAALAAAVVALVSPVAALRPPAAAVALALVTTILVLGLIGALAGQRRRAAARAAARLAAQDPAPCLVSDAAGVLLQVNPAADRRLQARPGMSVATLLGDRFANPAAVMLRLASRALADGWACEDVVTRQGQTRLVVHRHDAILIWRIEEIADRGPPGRGAEGLSLPMLVANRAGVVLFANDAMRRLLGGRPRRLDRVFTALNARSGEEVQVSTLEGPVAALCAEVEGPGDRREVYLLPVPERPATPAVQADFEHLPVALMRVAGDGTVLAANRAARELLGAGEVAGQPFADLVEGLGRSVQDWIADVLAERTPGGSEVLRPRHGPEDSFLQLTLRRIVERNRPQVLVVLQDATALKTLEAQFVQSQKMQAIGQLAGGIAHDFNNLLTAISGHCDLLLMRHDPGEADFADLEQIRQNANRAASLVGQLLAFSRKQTLKPELIDLNDALADLTHLLNRLVGDRIKLRLVPGTQLGAVRADRRQLEQVLMNLVVNARDAMPEGGTVRIETSVLTLDGESRRGRAVVPPGDYVRITVA
ncbi:MAG: PAS domain-containing protein, partial [Rhodobacterales bacterium]|nr:PAS domain-containing protein [Rhodobacterales bacterium]